MQKTAHRLLSPTAAAVLALGAALAAAAPAHAAETTALRCERVGSPAQDPVIGRLAELVAVPVPGVDTVAGVSCDEVPAGDPRVNFCAARELTPLLAVGSRPSRDHTCP
ncbi:hypothetical protein ABT354_12635 [Streptomyces sp. NPDC000594]|uniref:hypothetical protein n=1 Tax=Streptomyces sp. NPDC000594 TaxID=3154261 RepID=UPI0033170E19